MRLHRLEVTAFGPFAAHQEVDFDRLSDAGLFLLHGPTGAGKTSVLDAICFALYGRVPGVRGITNRLRSDHAAPNVGPEVRCDFTVAGRRFEVTRSPEWHRPKKRGTGTMREQAHVVLREWVGGEWIGLTNRIDEAADLLDQVIGLGAEQFTKLILLPQGEFAAFLRATAEERRALLQKLFGTDRFAEVERWLADRRREFEHHIQTANVTTARLFARAEEARLPELDFVVAPSEPGVPELEAATALVTAWADAARIELGAAHAAVREAEREHEAARLAADEAAEALRRQERLAELAAELGRLQAAGPQVEERRAALAAASHAVLLAPLLAELDGAQQRLQTARKRLVQTEQQALAASVDPGAVSAQQEGALRGELGSLAELLVAEQDLGRIEARCTTAERQIEAAERDQASTDQALAELTERRTELTERRSAAELLAVTLPDCERASARATTLAKAVLELQQLIPKRTAAQDTLRSAIDVHQAAVGALQRLRAQRLDGMAAELAAGLRGESPCPVCGSAEHPAPAEPDAPLVTEAAQEQAEAAEAAALAARERAQDAVTAVAQRCAALEAVTEGADAQTAAAGLAEAAARVSRARAARTEVEHIIAELDAVGSELAGAQERRQVAGDRAGAAREALAELDGRRADLHERLEHGRGDDPTVRARHQRLTSAVGAVAECLAARQQTEQATEHLARAQAAAVQGTEAAGFTDPDAARRAMLPAGERERLAAELARHDAQLSRVVTLLAETEAEIQAKATGQGGAAEPSEPAGEASSQSDPSASCEPAADSEPSDTFQLDLFTEQAPAPKPLPDLVRASAGAATGTAPASRAVPVEPLTLDRLRAAQAEARAVHESARRRHTLAAHAVRALSGLAAELSAHAAATAPLRRQFAALESVSKCVDGTGGDNALRMRLSSYVLAARLEQVAEAASIRLSAMSGGRYLLVHTDGPSRGGARSGLGLAVIDGWTGIQRDPASLSGGETFCTSLALALGLADVVQAEAGGSVIETLLVDEGFGSLDEQTLDEVMDVLDGLRSAGRSVGLVSHVADLRDRIPAQLQVKKSRTGSRLIA